MKEAKTFQATRRQVVLAAAGRMLITGADSKAPALAEFGPKSKAILSGVLEDSAFRGRIPESAVAVLMAREKLSRDALMMKLLPVAQSLASPPISKYFVGAIAGGTSGHLYVGANIEVPGNMLGLAVHAEQAAIANAYMSGETGIEAIAVTAAPCGHCRQFLSEVSVSSSMRVLVSTAQPMTLAELLPNAFGPKDLGFKQGAFPVRESEMVLVQESNDALVSAALKAARSAYAPYTRSASGVALATSSGRVFAGSYIENAAFNPSLPPLEAALAGYFAAGHFAGTIERVILVESAERQISHQATTRSVLAAIVPKAQFDVRLGRV